MIIAFAWKIDSWRVVHQHANSLHPCPPEHQIHACMASSRVGQIASAQTESSAAGSSADGHGLPWPPGRSVTTVFFSVARHLVGKPDKGSGDDLQWFLLGRRLSTFCYCKIHQHHSICYSISSMLFPMSWWFILQPPQLWHSLPGSPKKIRQCEGIACQAASGGGYVQAIVTSDFLAMAFRQVSWMSSEVFYEHKLFGSSWWDSPLFNHPKTWCFCIL